MCSKIGFISLTAAEISNLVVLMTRGCLSTLDARVYLGGVELVTRREIAKSVRRRNGNHREKRAQFNIKELVTVTQEQAFSSVKRALKKLENAGLLRFSTEQIELTRIGMFPDSKLCVELEKRGALSRLVPVPRKLFTELCRETKRSIFLSKLAYIIRGIALDKRTGELRSRGCVKASWIAEHFGLSLRSVRLARRSLIAAGFIEKDTASFQRKLNRDGSYFEIDLNQYAGTINAEKKHQSKKIESVPAQSNGESAGTLESIENGREMPLRAQNPVAPPQPKNCPQISPPIEKQISPNGSKNQNSRHAEPPGVCRANRGTAQKENPPTTPNLKNIHFEDLRRISTLKELYRQAIVAGWLSDSEAAFRNFVAAAVRATRIKCADPVRVFVAVVRRKLWHHITQEQEDRAAEVIVRARRWTSGDVFREVSAQVELSKLFSDHKAGSRIRLDWDRHLRSQLDI